MSSKMFSQPLRPLFVLFLIAVFVADATAFGDSLETPRVAIYSGKITPRDVAEGKGALTKGFQVTWYAPGLGGDAPGALFVAKENLHALDWFLRAGFADPAGPAGPRVGYRLDGHAWLVKLPPLVMTGLLAKAIEQPGNEIREETIAGRSCLIFTGKLSNHRRAEVTIDAGTGQLIAYDGTLVMGRGDRFGLTLTLSETKNLSANEAAKEAAVAKRIHEVLPDLSRTHDPFLLQLSEAKLTEIAQDRAAWLAAAKETDFKDFVNSLLREVDQERDRHAKMKASAGKFVGKPAPELPTATLAGEPFDAKSVKGKTVVLHFWEYGRESLHNPFGQVGPLDFLARHHEKDDVRVIGVAVDGRFGNAETSLDARQSAAKFAEFMHLSYDLCRDNGSLLEQYQDPKASSVELPVWAVIDPSGTVRFYKTGLFRIENPNAGLTELEQAVTKCLKSK